MSNINHGTAISPFMIPSALTKKECVSLIKICKKKGKAGGIFEPKSDTAADYSLGEASTKRRSSIVRMGIDEASWVYERIQSVLAKANQAFNYDMSNAGIEDFQIAEYSAKNKGTYGWHMDMGPGAMTRKFGISIPLNDSGEYEGGELQFNYGIVHSVEQEIGQAIVFPSFAMHRVTPVTRGARYSLVVWVHGTPFR